MPVSFSAYTDATKRYLYDYVTIPIFLLGIIYSTYTGMVINSFITTVVVFFIFMVFALFNGVSGGDVKFVTALAVWFGYPLIIYVIAIGSVLCVLYGIFHLYRLGLLKKRMGTFLKEVYMRLMYRQKTTQINSLPENGEDMPEALPFGTFLALGAWITYLAVQVMIL